MGFNPVIQQNSPRRSFGLLTNRIRHCASSREALPSARPKKSSLACAPNSRNGENCR